MSIKHHSVFSNDELVGIIEGYGIGLGEWRFRPRIAGLVDILKIAHANELTRIKSIKGILVYFACAQKPDA